MRAVGLRLACALLFMVWALLVASSGSTGTSGWVRDSAPLFLICSIAAFGVAAIGIKMVPMLHAAATCTIVVGSGWIIAAPFNDTRIPLHFGAAITALGVLMRTAVTVARRGSPPIRGRTYIAPIGLTAVIATAAPLFMTSWFPYGTVTAVLSALGLLVLGVELRIRLAAPEATP